MPAYDYRCDSCEETVTRHHSMFEGVPVLCPDCGRKMRKLITTMPRVNWNGLPPHRDQGHGPAAQELLQNVDRNRDAYLAKKEARHDPD